MPQHDTTAAILQSSPRAATLLKFLIAKANNVTHASFWRVSKIITACGFSKATYHRAIRELTKAGLVTVKERTERCGRQMSNEYILNMELLTSGAKEQRTAAPAVKAASSVRLTGMAYKIYLYLQVKCGRKGYRVGRKEIAVACGVTPVTVGRYIRFLESKGYIRCQEDKRADNKIYDTAVTNKICAENPIRLTTLPKKASEKVIEALSQKDQSALESILPQLPVIDQCILRFLLYTGLRMGELIQLTWQDWTKSKDCIRITDSKTKAGIRLVPLIPETRTILQYLYSKKQKHCPHIFSIGDNPVTQSHLRHICNKAAKIAEIAHLTPHILRHTFATRLIECGVDPKSVSVIIGHKNVAFTLQRYVTIDTQHIANEIQVLSTLRKMPLANQSDTLHTCGIA